MKYLKIAAICMLLAFAMAQEVTEEDNVLVLTNENFDSVLAKNEHVLVEFYAPWCGHCKSLAPEYAKAAKVLKEATPRVVLGKVDATVHKDLGTRFQVNGYPTLKFFTNGEPVEYTGGRTEDTIVSWCKKKSGPSTVELTTSEELEKFTQDNAVAAVLFGNNDSPLFKQVDEVAKTYDDVVFAWTKNDDLRAAQEVSADQFVLYRNFEERKLVLTGEQSVKDFVAANYLPTVLEFDQKAAQKIFGDGLPTLFVFYKENDAESDKAVAALKEASTTLKGKIILSTSQTVRDIGKRLAEYIGVESNLPTVRIVNPTAENIVKYELTEDITPENLVKFYEGYASGSLKPTFKSEEVPESNDAPVKVLVGKNWEQIVLDSSKDVLVKYYAPWCGHCKTLAPIYDAVAEKLLSNPNVVLAKMDSTTNEVDGVNIEGFPTLKFYPAKSKNPVDFNGDRTEDGIIKFLKENASVEWVDAKKGDL